jgi:hypothetical protein
MTWGEGSGSKVDSKSEGGLGRRKVGAKGKETGQRPDGGERVRTEWDGWRWAKPCRTDINTGLAHSTTPPTEPNGKRKIGCANRH